MNGTLFIYIYQRAMLGTKLVNTNKTCALLEIIFGWAYKLLKPGFTPNNQGTDLLSTYRVFHTNWVQAHSLKIYLPTIY
jgi:hypothetical protein